MPAYSRTSGSANRLSRVPKRRLFLLTETALSVSGMLGPRSLRSCLVLRSKNASKRAFTTGDLLFFQ